MEIVTIFEGTLYAFHYDNEEENEYIRLMQLWLNVNYLREFAKQNSILDVKNFVETIPAIAEKIQRLLHEIDTKGKSLETLFEPLSNKELEERLPKEKMKRGVLRIYAIRIGSNCYIITGGAIKQSQTMQEHFTTNDELSKLDKAKQYLKSNGIVAMDSFYDFLNE